KLSAAQIFPPVIPVCKIVGMLRLHCLADLQRQVRPIA
ncbi:MAG: hypothetical protein ACI95S_002711, partial [Dinoroseobacter sp.]